MRFVPVVVVLAALTASPPAGASASVSKAELIRKGDALCAGVQRQLVPLRARAQAATSLPEAQKWVVAADLWADQIRIQRRFVARFRAIGVPPDDSRARALRSGLDRGVVLATRVQRAFAERDTARLPAALTAYLSLTTELNRKVRAYGFRVCGR